MAQITTELKEQAKSLLRQINPSETDEALDRLVDFGFGLAANPNSFIEVLETEVIIRKNS